MSFFYDRDQNVTGTIPASFTFTPSYGMQISFSSELAEYGTVDNYIYNMPKGLNHLQVQISMPFENRKQEEARQIVGFFESLQGTGYFAYTDAAQIYKPLNLFVNNIDNTYNENDLYNINVSASTDQSSTLLNWNNLFVTGSNIKGDWATSTSYSKYDVVRYTGNATFPSNTSNLYDSFYYCKQSHTSQSTLNPSSVDNINWSREFFFQPTYSTQVSKETSVIKTELPYSFTKRTNFGLHANTLKQFRLDFKGVSDAEARCILHFLISRQGYKRFQYKIPKIYNQYKLFYAPQWQHTFVYKNVNDISITLIEDPVGKDVNELENIVTNGLVYYANSSNLGSYRPGSSSVYDLSGNNNIATLNGSPTFSTQNKGCFSFDGINDYISIPNTSLLRPSTEMTISMWAKATSIPGGWSILFGQSPYIGGPLIFIEQSAIGEIRALHYPNGSEVRCNTNYPISTTAFTHITFTFKTGDAIRSYFNGVANITASLPSGNFSYNTSNPYLIGINGVSWFNGLVGSVYVYNRAISASEVLQNFNAGKERFKVYG